MLKLDAPKCNCNINDANRECEFKSNILSTSVHKYTVFPFSIDEMAQSKEVDLIKTCSSCLWNTLLINAQLGRVSRLVHYSQPTFPLSSRPRMRFTISFSLLTNVTVASFVPFLFTPSKLKFKFYNCDEVCIQQVLWNENIIYFVLCSTTM